jgi:hypothetical protein
VITQDTKQNQNWNITDWASGHMPKASAKKKQVLLIKSRSNSSEKTQNDKTHRTG